MEEQWESWPNGEMDWKDYGVCKNCGNPLVEDEIDLCDECFAKMPMDTWITARGNNETGEWK